MEILFNLLDGKKIEFKTDKTSITIGRSSKCDLIILNESMSRRHCLIELKDGDFYITDLGSINGVFIDGIKIPPLKPTLFFTYLQLSFGYVTSVQFLVEEKVKSTNSALEVLSPPSQQINQINLSNKLNSSANKPEKIKPTTGKKLISNGPKKNPLLPKLIVLILILITTYFVLHQKNSENEQSADEQLEKVDYNQPF